MDGSTVGARYDALVEDRVDDGVFRVDRSSYIDPAIFEREIEAIYENGWIFLCHESQIAATGDYFATEIGRQPVFVSRQTDGSVQCFINACSHRGALLTPYKQGNAKVHTCRFHGWSFNCDGRCIRVKAEDTGYPEGQFDRGQYDLRPIAKCGSYKGFVFGSLGADVPDLEGYLGAAMPWIDLMAAQSPDGLEVVRGSSTYMIRGNWKLQAENSVDGYHVSTVHRVFGTTIGNREAKTAHTGMGKTEAGRIAGNVNSGGYDLGNGHMAIWAQHTTPEVRPIYEAKEWLEKELAPVQVDWILNRGRNLYLFPNVNFMDNPSTQIRVLKPISVDLTEVTVYCIAPVGESREARMARLRKFEDFYLTAGMATSDDIAALEETQDGCHATFDRWNDFNRGLDEVVRGADDEAKALGFEPVTSAHNWDHEALFHGLYRRWHELLRNGDGQS